MHYRKIYELNYGEIPNEFVIHHIDHNHHNNEIRNLIAIPKKLHSQYHFSYSWVKSYDPQTMIEDKKRFLEWLEYFNEKYSLIMEYVNNRNLSEVQRVYCKPELYANS